MDDFRSFNRNNIKFPDDLHWVVIDEKRQIRKGDYLYVPAHPDVIIAGWVVDIYQDWLFLIQAKLSDDMQRFPPTHYHAIYFPSAKERLLIQRLWFWECGYLQDVASPNPEDDADRGGEEPGAEEVKERIPQCKYYGYPDREPKVISYQAQEEEEEGAAEPDVANQKGCCCFSAKVDPCAEVDLFDKHIPRDFLRAYPRWDAEVNSWGMAPNASYPSFNFTYLVCQNISKAFWYEFKQFCGAKPGTYPKNRIANANLCHRGSFYFNGQYVIRKAWKKTTKYPKEWFRKTGMCLIS
jgi:hypothetical protein